MEGNVNIEEENELIKVEPSLFEDNEISTGAVMTQDLQDENMEIRNEYINPSVLEGRVLVFSEAGIPFSFEQEGEVVYKGDNLEFQQNSLQLQNSIDIELEKMKSDKIKWTIIEVELLLDLLRDASKEDLMFLRRNKALVQKIKKVLDDNGSHHSIQSIIKKWSNLLTQYRKVVAKKTIDGGIISIKSHWIHFEAMCNLLRKVDHPLGTSDGLPAPSHNTSSQLTSHDIPGASSPTKDNSRSPPRPSEGTTSIRETEPSCTLGSEPVQAFVLPDDESEVQITSSIPPLKRKPDDELSDSRDIYSDIYSSVKKMRLLERLMANSRKNSEENFSSLNLINKSLTMLNSSITKLNDCMGRVDHNCARMADSLEKMTNFLEKL